MGKSQPIDPVEQYIKAATDLRDLIRQAHEVIKDMKTFIKETRQVRDDLPKSIVLYLDQCVREGLDEFGSTLEEAIKESEARLFGRYDQITAILMGDEDKANGGETLEEQVLRLIHVMSPVERKILYAKAREELGSKASLKSMNRVDLKDTALGKGKQWSLIRY
jgi:hypothetical protein